MLKAFMMLVVGLALGFGGGILFSSRNPDQAANIANKEEVHILDAKIAMAKAHKGFLDQAANKPNADPATVANRDKVATEIATLEAQRDAKK